MRFVNPTNGYSETVPLLAPLWVALFGAAYLAYRGLWTHVILSLLFVCITLGIGWLVYVLFYPFVIRWIIAQNYRRSGWVERNSQPLRPLT